MATSAEREEKLKADRREYYINNIDRIKISAREWRAKNPEKAKKIQLRHRATDKFKRNVRDRVYQQKYGISLEIYENMLASQSGVCFICKQPEKDMLRGAVKKLAVDHCHTTGKARKLLCSRCNSVIGLANENPELLTNIIQYMKDHNGA